MKNPRSKLCFAGAMALALTLGFSFTPAQGPDDITGDPRPAPCFDNLINFQSSVLANDPVDPVVVVLDPQLDNLNPDYDHQDSNYVLTDFVIRGAAPGAVTFRRNGLTTFLIQETSDEQHMESSNFTTGFVFEPNDVLVALIAPTSSTPNTVISISVTGYQCREE